MCRTSNKWDSYAHTINLISSFEKYAGFNGCFVVGVTFSGFNYRIWDKRFFPSVHAHPHIKNMQDERGDSITQARKSHDPTLGSQQWDSCLEQTITVTMIHFTEWW